MGGVFISYRRADAPGHAGRVFDRVRARFGADAVFMDVAAIDAGVDFVDAIDEAVGACDALLAIIGPQWVVDRKREIDRRLDGRVDFVHIEIAHALKRDVRVVPVLVDGAQLPAASDLPEDLQGLLRRNAIELRDAQWDADMDRLIASLDRVVKRDERPLWVGARSRGRMFATLAVAALAIGGAVVVGPRACAPPDINVSRRVDPPSANAATPTTATPSPAPKPSAVVPDVVGKSLATARRLLGEAGVAVSRVSYVEDRSKPVEQVLIQTRVPAGAAGAAGVALTVVARVTVIVSHRPEDAEVARGLVAHLQGSPIALGFAVRARETPAVRAESLARVTYSDETLAITAADVAKEATSWLRQTEASRPALTAAVYRPVVSRTLIIGLPGSGPAASGAATAVTVPDVRGLSVGDARRLLTGRGITVLENRWVVDAARKPLEVVAQREVPGRVAGTSAVSLDVVARTTLYIEYLQSDAATVERFVADLRPRMSSLGILLDLQPVPVVKPVLVGKVFAVGSQSREAATVARFATDWLTAHTGRSVPIETATDRTITAQRMMFGLPSLR